MRGSTLRLVGRLVEASNQTFLAVDEDRTQWVYKPVGGEAPLWDFPLGTLGRREVAAFVLSEGAGFAVVPETLWVDDGPLGPGSLQRWVEAAGDELVDLVTFDQVPQDWFGFVVGVDEHDNDVALVHANHPALRRLALFDAVANNSDRKGGHIIRRDERVFGVDHGVSFHVEPKLRTVLWGWSGEPLAPAERALLEAVPTMAGELGRWLSDEEVTACLARAEGLLRQGHFPEPRQDWPVIPWPVL